MLYIQGTVENNETFVVACQSALIALINFATRRMMDYLTAASHAKREFVA